VLYLIMTAPECSAPTAAVVLLLPFASERKGVLRPLTLLARRLAAAGVASLRFDYCGTGESTGDGAALTLAQMRADAQAVLNYGRMRWPAARWSACGVRLGANLAAELLESGDCGHALLVEPLLNGNDYITELLRRTQIREMAAHGQALTTGSSIQHCWDQGEAVDFDGIAMAPILAQELAGLCLMTSLQALSGAADLMRVTAARQMPGQWQQCAELLAARGGQTQLVREKPFWGQLEYAEPVQTLDMCLQLIGARHNNDQHRTYSGTTS